MCFWRAVLNHKNRETKRGQETGETEKALMFCPQKERHMSEAELLKTSLGEVGGKDGTSF